MQLAAALADYDRFRAGVFEKRDGLAIGNRACLAVIMAVVTGIMAQVRVGLPWTPVPVTGQVFAVLLSGALLGGTFGSLSQLLYLALGVAGMPLFNDFSSGFTVLAGPTGGYLLGFIPAAFAVGFMVDRFPAVRTLPGLSLVMALTTLLCIYLPGTVHLAFWHRAVAGSFPGLPRLLMMAVVPFLPGEAVKVTAAVLAGRLFGPPPSCNER